MEWMESIGTVIEYIEEHMTEDISVEELSKQVHISPFYLQKGFSLLCGFTISEYVRKRRLALAGSELVSSHMKVIDAALKYGYDSPRQLYKSIHPFPWNFTCCSAKRRGNPQSFCAAANRIIIERWLSYGLQNYGKRQLHSYWCFKNLQV